MVGRAGSDKIQTILRETDHPELPLEPFEIEFSIHVDGAKSWSWADIKNNASVKKPSITPFNEMIADTMEGKLK